MARKHKRIRRILALLKLRQAKKKRLLVEQRKDELSRELGFRKLESRRVLSVSGSFAAGVLQINVADDGSSTAAVLAVDSKDASQFFVDTDFDGKVSGGDIKGNIADILRINVLGDGKAGSFDWIGDFTAAKLNSADGLGNVVTVAAIDDVSFNAQFSAQDSISLSVKDAVSLGNEFSTTDDLVITTTSGEVTDLSTAKINVADDLTITAGNNITLNESATNKWTVGDVSSFTAKAGDGTRFDISIGTAGEYNSTSIQALGEDISIFEDSATTLDLIDSSKSLSIDSSDAITDTASASITVGTTGSFSGDSILLASDATDSLKITGNTSFTATVSTVDIGVAGTVELGSISASGTDITIQEDASTSLDQITASDDLSISSTGDITNVANADVDVTDNASFSGTNITLGDQASDSFKFGSLTFNTAGAAVILEDDATKLVGTSSAKSLALTSTGAITNDLTAKVTVTNNASFDGTAITLGTIAGDEFKFGSLTFNSTGAVSISEDDATQLTGASSAASLLLVSSAAITNDATAKVTVTNNASFDGTSITLGTTAGDEFKFGSLTFNSAGAVTISEDDATQLIGTSSAASLLLSSSGAITNDTTAKVNVTNNASFNGTAITLGTIAGDEFKFGSLTFNSAGAVSISEDDATQLTATSTAASLLLVSGGALTNDATAKVTVTNNASFGGTSITLGTTAGDEFKLGSLAFNSAGAVSINEDDSTQLSGTSTAASLLLVSADAITNDATAKVTVTNNATFNGTAITLGTTAGDEFKFGSLTFNSAGAVSISEDDATQLIGTSSADSLLLVSGGALTNDATAKVTVTNNASFGGTSITLGTTAGDEFKFGSLAFNSSGAVSISEDDSTQLSGTSTAASLLLVSSDAITNDATAKVTITNNASFDGTAITLGTTAGDEFKFGSLTFNSAGAVSISEDDATQLIGKSSAASLVLVSSGALTNDATAKVTVTNNASFGGTSITLGTIAGDEFKFGTLTANSTGTAKIHEDDATVLAGDSTVVNLEIVSADTITNAANAKVQVSGNASFDGTSITLGNQAGDSFKLAGLTLNTPNDASLELDGDSAFQNTSSVGKTLTIVSTAALNSAASAALTVTQSADFNATSINLGAQAGDQFKFGDLRVNSAGNVVVEEDDDMQIVGTNTASNLTLVSTGNLTNDAAAKITVTNQASFSGATVSIGNQAGDEMKFGTLEFKSAGTVSIFEDDATVLSGTSSANKLTLDSKGSITNVNSASLVVTNNANFSGTSIALGDKTSDNFQFGSLTFTTAGSAAFEEDDATNLIGTSSALSLSLKSDGAITNDSTANVTITNNASFDGVSITLGFVAGDQFKFGSLTVNSTGAAKVSENDATILSGNSKVASLELVSAGSITNEANASLETTGNASLAGTSITLGDKAGDSFKLATITLTSAGPANLALDGAGKFEGTSVLGDTLTITSTSSLGNLANAKVSVVNAATFDATSIDLGSQTNDEFKFGTLNFNSTGSVTVQEDDSMLVTGNNTAATLSLVSSAELTNAAAAKINVTGQAAFQGTKVTLGNELNDEMKFGSLRFNSAGDVLIIENDSTDLSGASTAKTLNLQSGGAITNQASATLDVTNNAKFSGSSIALGDKTGDNFKFGSLTFNTAGSASFIEDDSTLLVDVSTANSLFLKSTVSIGNDASADVLIAQNASFDAANIDIGNVAADKFNFGTLTVQSTTQATISEDSDTVFEGTSSVADLDLISIGTITNLANAELVATVNADFDAQSVTLGNKAGDNFDLATLTLTTVGDATLELDQKSFFTGDSDVGAKLTLQVTGDIGNKANATLDVVGNASITAVNIDLGNQLNDSMKFGSLTFSGSGVSISEDDNTDLSGASDAGTLLLQSAGNISDNPAGTSLTVTGNATFVATDITLANAGADVSVGGAAFFNATTDVTIGKNGNVNFGSVGFLAQNVLVTEDSQTHFDGVSVAKLDYKSTDLITQSGNNTGAGTRFVEVTGTTSLTLSDNKGSVLLLRASSNPNVVANQNDGLLMNNNLQGTLTIAGVTDDLRLRNIGASPDFNIVPATLKNLEFWYPLHAISTPNSKLIITEDLTLIAGVDVADITQAAPNELAVVSKAGATISDNGTKWSVGGNASFLAADSITINDVAGEELIVNSGRTSFASFGGKDITVGSAGQTEVKSFSFYSDSLAAPGTRGNVTIQLDAGNTLTNTVVPQPDGRTLGNLAQNVTISSNGLTDDVGTIVDITNKLSVTSLGSVVLADNATDSFKVGGDAVVIARNDAGTPAFGDDTIFDVSIGSKAPPLQADSGATVQLGSFAAVGGVVALSEDNNTVLQNVDGTFGFTASQSLWVQSAGTITDANGTNLSIGIDLASGNITNANASATLLAADGIVLADNNADVLTVTGDLRMLARTSGGVLQDISVGESVGNNIDSNASANFNTVAAVGARVSVIEDSATTLRNFDATEKFQASDNLWVSSAGSIDDFSNGGLGEGTQISVGKNASLVANGTISLADFATDELIVGEDLRLVAHKGVLPGASGGVNAADLFDIVVGTDSTSAVPVLTTTRFNSVSAVGKNVTIFEDGDMNVENVTLNQNGVDTEYYFLVSQELKLQASFVDNSDKGGISDSAGIELLADRGLLDADSTITLADSSGDSILIANDARFVAHKGALVNPVGSINNANLANITVGTDSTLAVPVPTTTSFGTLGFVGADVAVFEDGNTALQNVVVNKDGVDTEFFNLASGKLQIQATSLGGVELGTITDLANTQTFANEALFDADSSITLADSAGDVLSVTTDARFVAHLGALVTPVGAINTANLSDITIGTDPTSAAPVATTTTFGTVGAVGKEVSIYEDGNTQIRNVIVNKGGVDTEFYNFASGEMKIHASFVNAGDAGSITDLANTQTFANKALFDADSTITLADSAGDELSVTTDARFVAHLGALVNPVGAVNNANLSDITIGTDPTSAAPVATKTTYGTVGAIGKNVTIYEDGNTSLRNVVVNKDGVDTEHYILASGELKIHSSFVNAGDAGTIDDLANTQITANKALFDADSAITLADSANDLLNVSTDARFVAHLGALVNPVGSLNTANLSNVTVGTDVTSAAPISTTTTFGTVGVIGKEVAIYEDGNTELKNVIVNKDGVDSEFYNFASGEMKIQSSFVNAGDAGAITDFADTQTYANKALFDADSTITLADSANDELSVTTDVRFVAHLGALVNPVGSINTANLSNIVVGTDPTSAAPIATKTTFGTVGAIGKDVSVYEDGNTALRNVIVNTDGIDTEHFILASGELKIHSSFASAGDAGAITDVASTQITANKALFDADSSITLADSTNDLINVATDARFVAHLGALVNPVGSINPANLSNITVGTDTTSAAPVATTTTFGTLGAIGKEVSIYEDGNSLLKNVIVNKDGVDTEHFILASGEFKLQSTFVSAGESGKIEDVANTQITANKALFDADSSITLADSSSDSLNVTTDARFVAHLGALVTPVGAINTANLSNITVGTDPTSAAPISTTTTFGTVGAVGKEVSIYEDGNAQLRNVIVNKDGVDSEFYNFASGEMKIHASFVNAGDAGSITDFANTQTYANKALFDADSIITLADSAGDELSVSTDARFVAHLGALVNPVGSVNSANLSDITVGTDPTSAAPVATKTTYGTVGAIGKNVTIYEDGNTSLRNVIVNKDGVDTEHYILASGELKIHSSFVSAGDAGAIDDLANTQITANKALFDADSTITLADSTNDLLSVATDARFVAHLGALVNPVGSLNTANLSNVTVGTDVTSAAPISTTTTFGTVGVIGKEVAIYEDGNTELKNVIVNKDGVDSEFYNFASGEMKIQSSFVNAGDAGAITDFADTQTYANKALFDADSTITLADSANDELSVTTDVRFVAHLGALVNPVGSINTANLSNIVVGTDPTSAAPIATKTTFGTVGAIGKNVSVYEDGDTALRNVIVNKDGVDTEHFILASGELKIHSSFASAGDAGAITDVANTQITANKALFDADSSITLADSTNDSLNVTTDARFVAHLGALVNPVGSINAANLSNITVGTDTTSAAPIATTTTFGTVGAIGKEVSLYEDGNTLLKNVIVNTDGVDTEHFILASGEFKLQSTFVNAGEAGKIEDAANTQITANKALFDADSSITLADSTSDLLNVATDARFVAHLGALVNPVGSINTANLSNITVGTDTTSAAPIATTTTFGTVGAIGKDVSIYEDGNSLLKNVIVNTDGVDTEHFILASGEFKLQSTFVNVGEAGKIEDVANTQTYANKALFDADSTITLADSVGDELSVTTDARFVAHLGAPVNPVGSINTANLSDITIGTDTTSAAPIATTTTFGTVGVIGKEVAIYEDGNTALKNVIVNKDGVDSEFYNFASGELKIQSTFVSAGDAGAITDVANTQIYANKALFDADSSITLADSASDELSVTTDARFVAHLGALVNPVGSLNTANLSNITVGTDVTSAAPISTTTTFGTVGVIGKEVAIYEDGNTELKNVIVNKDGVDSEFYNFASGEMKIQSSFVNAGDAGAITDFADTQTYANKALFDADSTITLADSASDELSVTTDVRFVAHLGALVNPVGSINAANLSNITVGTDPTSAAPIATKTTFGTVGAIGKNVSVYEDGDTALRNVTVNKDGVDTEHFILASGELKIHSSFVNAGDAGAITDVANTQITANKALFDADSSITLADSTNDLLNVTTDARFVAHLGALVNPVGSINAANLSNITVGTDTTSAAPISTITTFGTLGAIGKEVSIYEDGNSLLKNVIVNKDGVDIEHFILASGEFKLQSTFVNAGESGKIEDVASTQVTANKALFDADSSITLADSANDLINVATDARFVAHLGALVNPVGSINTANLSNITVGTDTTSAAPISTTTTFGTLGAIGKDVSIYEDGNSLLRNVIVNTDGVDTEHFILASGEFKLQSTFVNAGEAGKIEDVANTQAYANKALFDADSTITLADSAGDELSVTTDARFVAHLGAPVNPVGSINTANLSNITVGTDTTSAAPVATTTTFGTVGVIGKEVAIYEDGNTELKNVIVNKDGVDSEFFNFASGELKIQSTFVSAGDAGAITDFADTQVYANKALFDADSSITLADSASDELSVTTDARFVAHLDALVNPVGSLNTANLSNVTVGTDVTSAAPISTTTTFGTVGVIGKEVAIYEDGNTELKNVIVNKDGVDSEFYNFASGEMKIQSSFVNAGDAGAITDFADTQTYANKALFDADSTITLADSASDELSVTTDVRFVAHLGALVNPVGSINTANLSNIVVGTDPTSAAPIATNTTFGTVGAIGKEVSIYEDGDTTLRNVIVNKDGVDTEHFILASGELKIHSSFASDVDAGAISDVANTQITANKALFDADSSITLADSSKDLMNVATDARFVAHLGALVAPVGSVNFADLSDITVGTDPTSVAPISTTTTFGTIGAIGQNVTVFEDGNALLKNVIVNKDGVDSEFFNLASGEMKIHASFVDAIEAGTIGDVANTQTFAGKALFDADSVITLADSASDVLNVIGDARFVGYKGALNLSAGLLNTANLANVTVGTDVTSATPVATNSTFGTVGAIGKDVTIFEDGDSVLKNVVVNRDGVDQEFYNFASGELRLQASFAGVANTGSITDVSNTQTYANRGLFDADASITLADSFGDELLITNDSRFVAHLGALAATRGTLDVSKLSDIVVGTDPTDLLAPPSLTQFGTLAAVGKNVTLFEDGDSVLRNVSVTKDAVESIFYFTASDKLFVHASLVDAANPGRISDFVNTQISAKNAVLDADHDITLVDQTSDTLDVNEHAMFLSRLPQGSVARSDDQFHNINIGTARTGAGQTNFGRVSLDGQNATIFENSDTLLITTRIEDDLRYTTLGRIRNDIAFQAEELTVDGLAIAVVGQGVQAKDSILSADISIHVGKTQFDTLSAFIGTANGKNGQNEALGAGGLFDLNANADGSGGVPLSNAQTFMGGLTLPNTSIDGAKTLAQLQNEFNYKTFVGPNYALYVRDVDQLEVKPIVAEGNSLKIYVETDPGADLTISDKVQINSTSTVNGKAVMIAGGQLEIAAGGFLETNNSGTTFGNRVTNDEFIADAFDGKMGIGSPFFTTRAVSAARSAAEFTLFNSLTNQAILAANPGIPLINDPEARHLKQIVSAQFGSAGEEGFLMIVLYADGKMQLFDTAAEIGRSAPLLASVPNDSIPAFLAGLPAQSASVERAVLFDRQFLNENPILPTSVVFRRSTDFFLFEESGAVDLNSKVDDVLGVGAAGNPPVVSIVVDVVPIVPTVLVQQQGFTELTSLNYGQNRYDDQRVDFKREPAVAIYKVEYTDANNNGQPEDTEIPAVNAESIKKSAGSREVLATGTASPDALTIESWIEQYRKNPTKVAGTYAIVAEDPKTGNTVLRVFSIRDFEESKDGSSNPTVELEMEIPMPDFGDGIPVPIKNDPAQGSESNGGASDGSAVKENDAEAAGDNQEGIVPAGKPSPGETSMLHQEVLPGRFQSAALAGGALWMLRVARREVKESSETMEETRQDQPQDTPVRFNRTARRMRRNSRTR